MDIQTTNLPPPDLDLPASGIQSQDSDDTSITSSTVSKMESFNTVNSQSSTLISTDSQQSPETQEKEENILDEQSRENEEANKKDDKPEEVYCSSPDYFTSDAGTEAEKSPHKNVEEFDAEPTSLEVTDILNSVDNVNSVEENRTIDNSDKLISDENKINTDEIAADSLDSINNSVSEIYQVCDSESPIDATKGETTKISDKPERSESPINIEINTTDSDSKENTITDVKSPEEQQPEQSDEIIKDVSDEIIKDVSDEIIKDVSDEIIKEVSNEIIETSENEILNVDDKENNLEMETAEILPSEENVISKDDNSTDDDKMDVDMTELISEDKTVEIIDDSTKQIEDNESNEGKESSRDNDDPSVFPTETDDKDATIDTFSEEADDQDLQQENPVFVHVNTKGDGESEGDKIMGADLDQSETGEESLEASCLNEEDPIGISQDKDDLMDFSEDVLAKEPLKVVDFNEAITSDKSTIDDELTSSKGADEELCIIPDTEREISQEEKDAARAAAAAAAEAATASINETTETSKTIEDRDTLDNSSSHSEVVQVDADASVDKSVDLTGNDQSSQKEKDLSSATPNFNQDDDASKKVHSEIKFTNIPENEQQDHLCHQCCNVRKCVFRIEEQEKPTFICGQTCLVSYRAISKNRPEILKAKTGLQLSAISKSMGTIDIGQDISESAVIPANKIFTRTCSECASTIDASEEKILSWETMDFCNEDCLSKYQNTIGSHCANCKNEVLVSSLGKYCVRFGHDIRQFCCSACLEEFKKGLKVCSYCQKDISGGQEGFLAPVGDKGQFKDFCTQMCMDKYEQMSNKNAVKKTSPEIAFCSVCNQEKVTHALFTQYDITHKFCSEPCFIAYKYVNNAVPKQCEMCKKYFDNDNSCQFSIFYDDTVKNFCSKTCQNIYIIANRRIVPCSWCKVKKYNFDMIRKMCTNGQILMMCSLNCLSLFQVSISAVSTKRMKCDHCHKVSQAQYHLTMSDATIRNFCAYPCVMAFQNQFSKIPITLNNQTTTTATDKPNQITTRATSATSAVPASGPKRNITRSTRSNDAAVSVNEVQLPVITSVQSLATPATNGPSTVTRSTAHKINNQQQTAVHTQATAIPIPIPQYKQHVVVKPPPLPPMKNAMTQCKPIMHTKGVSCRPHPCSKETQTEEMKEKTVLIPVPVPIYVPVPMPMYSAPIPVPIPFPLPIPVPIFIPTTRNSAPGILKEIKKIQVKIPTDPFEAELLMMAEMVAGEKKVDNTDSESEDDDTGDTGNDGGFSPEAVDTSNTFGDDMLQMALKMATELDEPAVDLEGALTANTITASQNQDQTGVVQTEESVDDPQPMHQLMDRGGTQLRGRKRPNRSPRNMNAAKRGRRMSHQVDMPLLPPPQPQPPEPIEKPDANMCLKYTFGVNAWKQWVTTKNAELEKSSRRVKLFKNEILQLTADELNYSLCLFVKEVRKPNGTEYAPDTIYYLCLGIQQYLFENGRIDNIFTDAYYEKFTDCLDEVAKKFSVLYNDSHYIVTRVEEEHLWESKQLGAHSPHVLLSTLMFFNTKHFNLTTVDEHMQLSFSHIMKHWKRNPNQPGAAKIPGSRNVLLRFYPPQTTLDSNSRKKKVYEQQENEENPLRCPVKLYEFYLSKCPESVKTRNDVFYLLPERSCVPDSPVWYSTMALGRDALEKMLHRVKMVKEINVALLTMD